MELIKERPHIFTLSTENWVGLAGAFAPRPGEAPAPAPARVKGKVFPHNNSQMAAPRGEDTASSEATTGAPAPRRKKNFDDILAGKWHL